MLFMSHDTINAFRKYLKLSEDKGLHRICGENVTVSEKETVVVCGHWSVKVFSVQLCKTV